MRRAFLGESHPDLARSMYNFADFPLRQQRYPESVTWSRLVLALRGTSLTDEHPIKPRR